MSASCRTCYRVFNPCFRGSSFRSLSITTLTGRKKFFNPCFRGSSFRSIAKCFPKRSSSVFNPCFRGSSFRSLFKHELRSDHKEFSILVFVDLAFEGSPRGHGGQQQEFSILVFVDLAFEVCDGLRGKPVRLIFNPCFRGSSFRRFGGPGQWHSYNFFNPCFRGSSFRRREAPIMARQLDTFSILVFVDLAFEVDIEG